MVRSQVRAEASARKLASVAISRQKRLLQDIFSTCRIIGDHGRQPKNRRRVTLDETLERAAVSCGGSRD